MFTSSFWEQAGERALKTFAQTLVASGIVVGVAGWDKWQAGCAHRRRYRRAAVGGDSVASGQHRRKGTPSLVSEELTPNVAAVIPEGDLEAEIPAPGLTSTQPTSGHRSSIPRACREPRHRSANSVAAVQRRICRR